MNSSTKYLFEFTSNGYSDEKKNIIKFLISRLQFLKGKNIFLDIGSGDGSITNAIGHFFKKIIIIEPNKTSYNFLIKTIGQRNRKFRVIQKKWEEVNLKQKPDLILCSHALYYFPNEQIVELVKKMYGKLKNTGELVIIINTPRTRFLYLLKKCFKNINKPVVRWIDTNLIETKFRAEFCCVEKHKIKSKIFTNSKKKLVDLLYSLTGAGNAIDRSYIIKEIIKSLPSKFGVNKLYTYPISSDVYIITKKGK